MKFRWTMKELEETSDDFLLRSLVVERMSDLNPYAPLAVRLGKIYKSLTNKIEVNE